MKGYTDLNQSKKLVNILPLESADMWYAERYAGQVMPNGQYIVEEKPVYYPSLIKPSDSNYSQDVIHDIPCWSLAALIDVLPSETRLLKSATDSTYHCDCPKCNSDKWFDNPVDACVEMIENLHNKMVYDFNNYRENE